MPEVCSRMSVWPSAESLLIALVLLIPGCSSSDSVSEPADGSSGKTIPKTATGETNYRFDLSEWIDQFPLEEKFGNYSAEIVASPVHICNNVHLRHELQGNFNWGRAVPVDIFVMADGEPPDRHVTKLGGVPYRPAKSPWPKAQNGEPMLFVGQFNFGDSRDIVGELPGDVLLVFADRTENGWKDFEFEWQPMGLDNLVSANAIPKQPNSFSSCYGYIYRTVSFPESRQMEVRGPNDQFGMSMGPVLRGKSVIQPYLLEQYQATQIGSAPFFIQGKPDMPGKILCTISSVKPDANSRYPWINHPDPLLPLGEVGFRSKHLMIYDVGCIYISIDDQRRLHAHMSCY